MPDHLRLSRHSSHHGSDSTKAASSGREWVLRYANLPLSYRKREGFPLTVQARQSVKPRSQRGGRYPVSGQFIAVSRSFRKGKHRKLTAKVNGEHRTRPPRATYRHGQAKFNGMLDQRSTRPHTRPLSRHLPQWSIHSVYYSKIRVTSSLSKAEMCLDWEKLYWAVSPVARGTH